MDTSQQQIWKPFLVYAQKRTYKRNEKIFRQSELGEGFYYLYEGEVIIKLLSEHGEERIIDYATPGEIIGEQGIKAEPYFATATVITSATLYFFSNEAFNNMCLKEPSASQVIMNSLINKIRLLGETVSLLDSPVEYQMAHLLDRLYQKRGSKTISLNQTSLARYIGTSRITVYKILQKWKEEGIIDVADRKIILKDIEQIKAKL